MRCLFCKKDSTNTKSVEHIVPESLGNKTFILPLGYVCDKCNNYFAREVEKPFLDMPEIKLLRFQEGIPNKKNRMPEIEGFFDQAIPVRMRRKIRHDAIVNEVDISSEGFNAILEGKGNMQIIFPAFTNDIQIKNGLIISRFLAKMALEAFAHKVKNIDHSLDDLIDDAKFDLLRNHARLGTTKDWPCNIRRVYDFHKIWRDKNGVLGQMIYETDFLLLPVNGEENKSGDIYAELYFVIILWGMEFAINMAGPEIEGYQNWLSENNNISPLYFGKNKNSDIY